MYPTYICIFSILIDYNYIFNLLIIFGSLYKHTLPFIFIKRIYCPEIIFYFLNSNFAYSNYFQLAQQVSLKLSTGNATIGSINGICSADLNRIYKSNATINFSQFNFFIRMIFRIWIL